jgi:hypothetical protein
MYLDPCSIEYEGKFAEEVAVIADPISTMIWRPGKQG